MALWFIGGLVSHSGENPLVSPRRIDHDPPIYITPGHLTCVSFDLATVPCPSISPLPVSMSPPDMHDLLPVSSAFSGRNCHTVYPWRPERHRASRFWQRNRRWQMTCPCHHRASCSPAVSWHRRAPIPLALLFPHSALVYSSPDLREP